MGSHPDDDHNNYEKVSDMPALVKYISSYSRVKNWEDHKKVIVFDHLKVYSFCNILEFNVRNNLMTII